ncbi:hypothetical protein EDB86DRAFT_2830868 [Lactarius hatsudake]|nr:hypothetical protein EDB86DRAFT_2830868 [Lactarius hatsudake]
MSTSNLSLTWDEQTLHHHAAMLKKELEAYHASEPKFMQKISVEYYFNANTRGPIPLQIHPLLLSLMEVINKGEATVNISSVSENNPRILSSNFYTSAKNLPPLNIHSPGQNDVDSLSGAHVCLLTLAASCQECMGSSAPAGSTMINMPPATSSLAPIASEHQDNSVGGDIMTISPAAFSVEPTASKPQEMKRKKDWHVSDSSTHNMLSNKIAKEIITRLAAKRSTANDISEAATGTASSA